VSVDVYE